MRLSFPLLSCCAVLSVVAALASPSAMAHNEEGAASEAPPWTQVASQGDTQVLLSDGIRLPARKTGPASANGKAIGKVAIVELSHPHKGKDPLSANQAERIILGPVQEFFNENVPGSVTFSIERKAKLALPFSPCDKESDAAAFVRSKLNIPESVRLVLLTQYAEQDSQCWYAGLATVSSPDTAGYIFHVFSPVDPPVGAIPGWASYVATEVMIHEMGHNFELPHTERFSCKGGTTPFDASKCYEFLGQSVHDVMGYGGHSSDPLVAPSRWELGGLPAAHVVHTPAKSGRAWLLRAHDGTTSPAAPAPRDGVPASYVLRLEDRAGSYWVEFRDTYGPVGTPFAPWESISPGAVVFMKSHISPKVAMSPWAELDKPVQVDADQAFTWRPDGTPLEEHVDFWSDTIVPGKSWTSPAGTRVTVESAAGGGILVSWEGPGDTTPPARPGSAPEVYTAAGTRVTSSQPASSASLRVMPPLLSVDAGVGTQSCTLKGAPGNPKLFLAEPVQPKPTSAWWQTRKAKSLTSGRVLKVSGGSLFFSDPAAPKAAPSGHGKGVAALVALKPGTYSLTWVCHDRAGNESKPSAASKVVVKR